MEKLKESLQLLREIELCESKHNTCNSLDSKKRYELCLKLALMFQKRCITYLEIPEFKEALKTEFLIPNEKEQKSELYQNVINAHKNWFSNGVEFNEYFKDAWEKLYQYVNPEELETKRSLGTLEIIYEQITYIFEEKTGEKISSSDSEFIGNFLTCFPNYEEKSVIKFAGNYIKEITIFLATMCPKELINLSLLDKIELGHIWTTKKDLQRVKKRKDERRCI